MRKQCIFTVALFLSVLCAQAADITPITKAFKAGNADLFKGNMDEEVNISVPGTTKKGTGNDAIVVLKTFFQANKVSDFTISHHADKNTSGFFVGKLLTEKGTFRVNVTYITKNNVILLQAIRIE
jgi:hypothetical protein